MLEDDTTLRYYTGRTHLTGKLRPGWCDNNSMVINPKKTHSMTIATRQKHQLLPLSLDLLLYGVKVEQVAEHRLFRNNYRQQTSVGYTY